ncbi:MULTISPECIES: 5-formyltetrahydrofolate cyclo-ligase [Micrococcaceae]|uniref:5-formyltetrahydrofolate cyclo-ligase n=1 Tax=Micrococcaceae TaxID=1268 RepID=UPI001617FA32|nr:5-formyltetrahydrofolate cyclo-ligase [Citricoccus sp.]MBB5749488.1 5-formyltetrahydrofolate cyclo-ligase [Micrococcus sp. TA1]HRO29577.1 5-formyltetrahydrofolate cyclo-ligase [Citricoccus sp.]HRO93604.1 5-formyltetrahydrofolate cyclo-ligase [Citricoccus sp.]
MSPNETAPQNQPEAQYSAKLTGDRGSTPEETLQWRKQDVRTLWRARRRELGEDERAEQSRALTRHVLDWYLPRARHRRAAVVMSYGTEPDTGPLRQALHEAGVEVLVPITEPERQLSWARWFPGVELARSPVAPIDEPVGERYGLETMRTVDLVLVPAQVVDLRGIRMGQGGGYYDRFLAGVRRQRQDGTNGENGPVTLASVFRHELMSRGFIPAGEFDVPVDGAVTADGLTWFGDEETSPGV